MRTTIFELSRMKRSGERIAMVTAYDHGAALLAERAGLKVLLVGDSLGMVVSGFDTTLPVTLEQMVYHTAMVTRGARTALVVADLPFLSYATLEQGIAAAGRLIRDGGAQAVKLEGAGANLPLVRRLVELGVPVMGHLGYTPQSTHQIGIRVQAKRAAAARALITDALALEAAGAFAIVLELVPRELAAEVTRRLAIPTIGIGAGAGCDGQVQVWHDILGLGLEAPPRHARVFTQAGAAIEEALKAYASDVAAGIFPTEANGSSMTPEALAEALAGLDDKTDSAA